MYIMDLQAAFVQALVHIDIFLLMNCMYIYFFYLMSGAKESLKFLKKKVLWELQEQKKNFKSPKANIWHSKSK